MVALDAEGRDRRGPLGQLVGRRFADEFITRPRSHPKHRCLVHYADARQPGSTRGVRASSTIRAALEGQKRGGGLVPGSCGLDEALVKPAWVGAAGANRFRRVAGMRSGPEPHGARATLGVSQEFAVRAFALDPSHAHVRRPTNTPVSQ